MGQSNCPFSPGAKPKIKIAITHSMPSVRDRQRRGSAGLRSNQPVRCGDCGGRQAKGMPIFRVCDEDKTLKLLTKKLVE
jgi:hypothetical protein